MDEWKYVEDELPLYSHWVIVWKPNGEPAVFEAQLSHTDKSGHHWNDAKDYSTIDIVAWMPLPEPPNRRSEVMSENSDKTGDSVDKYVLDPCPFCSGEVFVFQAWPNRWRVGCNTNDCFTMPARHDVFFSSPEEAIKHANQRDGYWTQEDLDRAAEEAEKMMDHFGIERDQK